MHDVAAGFPAKPVRCTPGYGTLPMKNLVFAILFLLAVIAGVGAYRGWFTVNKTKIQQDEQAVKDELQDLEQEVKTKADDLTGKSHTGK